MKLVNPLPMDAWYLYHYTSTKTAVERILPEGKLKFNPFSKVNDPRESKQWNISPFVRLYPELTLEEYDAISKEVSDALKVNAKLVCFSQDKKEAIKKCLQNRPDLVAVRVFMAQGQAGPGPVVGNSRF